MGWPLNVVYWVGDVENVEFVLMGGVLLAGTGGEAMRTVLFVFCGRGDEKAGPGESARHHITSALLDH